MSDGLLGRVSCFNQIGDLFRESTNADDATSAVTAGSSDDIRTISMERAVSGGMYALTSNPFAGDGPASESTLGWTLRRFDAAGRIASVDYYRGSAKPQPFGSNASSSAHESYSYSGASTTFTDAQGRTRTTTVDALGRIVAASAAGVSSATYGYDALDNLTSVTMTDPATYNNVPKTQTRTFVYTGSADGYRGNIRLCTGQPACGPKGAGYERFYADYSVGGLCAGGDTEGSSQWSYDGHQPRGVCRDEVPVDGLQFGDHGRRLGSAGVDFGASSLRGGCDRIVCHLQEGH